MAKALGKVAEKRKTLRAVTLGVLAFGVGSCLSAEKQKAPLQTTGPLASPQETSEGTQSAPGTDQVDARKTS